MPTLYAACACGSRRLNRLQGEELKVKTMELEERDHVRNPRLRRRGDLDCARARGRGDGGRGSRS
jgi:hypothetical protein